MAKHVDRSDTWMNLLTGLGTAARDNRQHTFAVANHFTQEEAEEIYAASRTAQRAVEVPQMVQLANGFSVVVKDATPAKQEQGATRPGVTFDALDVGASASAEFDAQRAINAQLEDLEVVAAFVKARNWERAYGGAAILMGVDDGQRFELPVRETTIKAVRYLTVLTRRECRAVKWNSNQRSPGYGTPTVYRVQRDSAGGVTGGGGGFEVHASRLLIFPGWTASRRMAARNNGWGHSIFDALYDSLRDYEVSFQTVPILLKDFAQLVWKVNGLAAIMAEDGDAADSGEATGGELVLRRMKIAQQVRSVLGVLITDKEDEFSREQTPMSGLPEALDRVAKKFAADVAVPPGLLYGDNPAGLNANGEQSLQFFYKEQNGQRQMVVKPRARQLVRYLFLALDGPTSGAEPSSWSVDFGPMYEPTASEVSAQRKAQADADVAYVNAGVLMPEEVAISRFGQPGGWSAETSLSQEARDAAEEAAEMMRQQMAQQPAPGEPPSNEPPADDEGEPTPPEEGE